MWARVSMTAVWSLHRQKHHSINTTVVTTSSYLSAVISMEIKLFLCSDLPITILFHQVEWGLLRAKKMCPWRICACSLLHDALGTCRWGTSFPISLSLLPKLAKASVCTWGPRSGSRQRVWTDCRHETCSACTGPWGLLWEGGQGSGQEEKGSWLENWARDQELGTGCLGTLMSQHKTPRNLRTLNSNLVFQDVMKE